MSIWTRISEAIAALAKGEGLAAVFERLRTPPERSVAFTIAVIALGAKMAKADGQVTRHEVAAFREVFTIAPGDEADAARVFNLARTDVAGFDLYARKIAAMFGPGDPVLVDLMEGLFHIAVADGEYHPHEDAFLRDVAAIFGIGDRCFRSLLGRFVPDAEADPYDVLGVSPEAPFDEIRAAWRRAVREHHPDRLVARGLPEEALQMAHARLVAVNRAWEQISGKKAA
ncbi:TerB family tellurite resistance protein [Albidovulum sp.]|uniref:TerB family tellurite resistance protein n=1 Tax=Albidovulum sp. TaxID=1872424 RepID=UPI001DE83284|nr:molecular chaperone DjiA [Paracoccaceae bacterium]MCC0047455.1 molecular chaperone DjiA [Defluviimonas sp.]HPE25359.1 molecular chaperone DjiA [Albidovulum sp.]MCB2118224.1 molecular chaperone DjiA [Paracoccaceae bacterium]MCB2121847.1 molecular chaperone DjiA [Paracoccaceae bacterium]